MRILGNGRLGRTGNVFFLFRGKERSKEKPFGSEEYMSARRERKVLKDDCENHKLSAIS